MKAHINWLKRRTLAVFGPRHPDFARDCPCCEAWAFFDKLTTPIKRCKPPTFDKLTTPIKCYKCSGCGVTISKGDEHGKWYSTPNGYYRLSCKPPTKRKRSKRRNDNG